ncbi:hypothetical protein Scep_029966 [Stephania cephalantha]|uniref:Uncharacterized protein n=1 Tax=Stephania cephalantha TaxID=152367 RepID=A0AAP0E1L4_9MAGN
MDNEDLQMRIVQQLYEISCPSSSSLMVPKEKIKTRGRKTKKGRNASQSTKKIKVTNADENEASTKRNLSHHEYLLHPRLIPMKTRRQVPAKVHRTRTWIQNVTKETYRCVAPE